MGRLFTLTGLKGRMSLSRVRITVSWTVAHLHNGDIVNKVFHFFIQFILPLILQDFRTKVDFPTFCLYLCVAGTKPLHCFSVHHWVVNTVQRSPFFKNIILSVGEWNFAIWREEVMVTTLVAAKTPARVRDYWPDAVFSTIRRVPSSCLQTLTKRTVRDAGPCPDLLFSSLGKRTAASRCGTFWKRRVSPCTSRSTSAKPRSPVWNPACFHVSPALGTLSSSCYS